MWYCYNATVWFTQSHEMLSVTNQNTALDTAFCPTLKLRRDSDRTRQRRINALFLVSTRRKPLRSSSLGDSGKLHRWCYYDPLCDLVARVPSYRSRGSKFDSRRYQLFWEGVSVELDPLSLVRITEDLLEWKSSGSGRLGHVTMTTRHPPTRKSWH
jgi:hypothetical protein